MYHKEKPRPPTADNVHEFDNNEFMENVYEKKKEIEDKMREEQEESKLEENPEISE